MKLEGYSIIGSKRGRGLAGSWQARNPITDLDLETFFHAEDEEGLDQAVALAEEAFTVFGESSGSVRAGLLRAIAEEIDALEEEIVARMMSETALPEPRCRGEKGRTVGQLRMLLIWSKKDLGSMPVLIWHSLIVNLSQSPTYAPCNAHLAQ